VDHLYYWQRHGSDTRAGPIYKLNQNSAAMQQIALGDDVWAIGLAGPASYRLIARFTVSEIGVNPSSSADFSEYGKYFFKSSAFLTSYFPPTRDVEAMVRTLSVTTNGQHLGQCFQGHAAVRPLCWSDRLALIDFASSL
jgi:hypothetical protein